MTEDLLNALNQFISKHMNEEDNVVLKKLRNSFFPSPQNKSVFDINTYRPHAFSEIAAEQVEYLEHVPDGTNLISTGFMSLDGELNCLRPGELVILGGRPGMGKTQLMVQLCINLLQQNIKCAYLSLELSANQLCKRFVANVSDLSFSEIDKIKSPAVKKVLINNINSIKNWPLYIEDNTSYHINDLMAVCEKLVNENSVKVVFIDYVQLLAMNSHKLNREQELSIVSGELKKLARRLNIVIICSSQLSRQVENRPGGSKRPQLSDLRESGAIEQDADKVVFIYRPEYYGLEVDENNRSTKNKVEIVIAKNRNGNCGTSVLYKTNNFSSLFEEDDIIRQIDDLLK